MRSQTFGAIDNRFLAQSVGMLNPPHPHSLSEAESLRLAIETLRLHRIGCVVVLNEEGKLAGIFSERDVVLRYCLNGVDHNTTTLKDIMTPAPKTISMTTPIAYALNLMSHGGFRHLPIVDDENYPVGIISVKNILDFLVQSLTRDLQQFAE